MIKFIITFVDDMDLNQLIPAYLVSKKNSTRLVLFTAGFALLFINLYSPFDVRNWFGLSLKSQELFFYSSLIILTGVLVAVISRVILYHYNKKKIKTKLWAFLLIIMLEVFCMALFFTIYESVFIKDDNRTYLEVFNVSVQNTALVLLLPYAVLWLYFSWLDKNHKIKELIESEEKIEFDANSMIPFLDEKGTMRITLKMDDILYIKGADNYVTIYYNKNNAISKFLLRNTIKNLEQRFINHPITRCHRSYMVNFDKIKVIRRERGGHILEIETDPPIEVPVSKTYIKEVFQLFENN
ncbi:LytR/AlgR family response regulator transcription factor [Plebeiibacterium sediminum]|uniref:LytTR family transcriptional regulator n=1 Tax=Plebeiibacterium sediminum TaxID=2992112 RepID=A0AAE3M7Z5_9BACT|nr:LytTR family DNA-binding domain-containing protein [Plebeiobacterium sediminum]MCW3788768.1 LytTR family transcriptional regulator [Plebeiobacterium sediminum]